MHTLLGFIVALGPLIFVHELGHFLFAKLFGVRVLKFSLGFGPKVFGKRFGETEYVLSAIPLGGYVKMFGENPDEQDVDQSDKAVSFAHKSVGQRFGIVLAGPLFNFLFTLVVFFFLFLIVGVPEIKDTTRIGQVIEGSPAASAGLQDNDVILEINGTLTEKWMDVLEGVRDSNGEAVAMVILRDNEEMSFSIAPKLEEVKNIFGEVEGQRYRVGIAPAEGYNYVSTGPFGAMKNAAKQTWAYVDMTLKGLVKLVQGVIPMSELGGPILIAKIAGQQMAAGWVNLMYFMGLLSVNLGILNLLPIPVLDGGHLMFLTIESIRRKPMEERAQIIAQQIGIALLGTLMVLVFYNDIF